MPDGPDDVVPIAGDSAGPDDAGPPPPTEPPTMPVVDGPPESPATPVVDGPVGDMVADSLDDLMGPPPESTGLLSPGDQRPRNPWLVTGIITALVLVVAVLVILGVHHSSSSSHSSAASSTTAAGSSSTTAAPTTTTAVSASDVTLTLGLGQVNGASTPLFITVQAAPDAPGALTVKVAMTGRGIPASDTYEVTPGRSVTHTVVGQGCGTWTVKVVSINGKPVNAAGNVNLENGATHAC